ncbi:MAG: glycosyltransferase [Halioglobus sp.]
MISVVIPTYNYGQYLCEAIESVLSQDYPEKELIVVDDGSTDNTQSLLSDYANHATCLFQDNAGIASARNAGYRVCKGDFIAFLDADDIFTAERLTLQMQAFREDPALQCVQGYMQQFVSPELPEEYAQTIRGETSGVVAAPLASTTLIRRAAYERVGCWDETLNVGVDLDWYARLRDSGVRYRMLEQVLLRRRIHTTNTNLRCADEQVERLRVLKKMLDRRRAAQPTCDGIPGEQFQ